MFTAQHYNALAKEIRELFPGYIDEPDTLPGRVLTGHQAILSVLALRLAIRFKKERDELGDKPHYEFDPIKFLNACSPNTDLYPLGELWQE